MFQHLKRKQTIYLPVFLLIVLIGLLTFHHATKERDLTPDGLSRNTEVADGAIGKVLTAKKVGNGYDIHFKRNGKLAYLQVNENLEVTNKQSLPVQLDLNASIWANHDKAYYLEDKELVYFDGKNKQIVDTDIDGFEASTEELFYWKEDRVYTIDPATNSSRKLLQTSDLITKLSTSEQKGLFAVINKKEQYTTEVSVYKTDKGEAQ